MSTLGQREHSRKWNLIHGLVAPSTAVHSTFLHTYISGVNMVTHHPQGRSPSPPHSPSEIWVWEEEPGPSFHPQVWQLPIRKWLSGPAKGLAGWNASGHGHIWISSPPPSTPPPLHPTPHPLFKGIGEMWGKCPGQCCLQPGLSLTVLSQSFPTTLKSL